MILLITTPDLNGTIYRRRKEKVEMARESEVEDSSKKQGRGCRDTQLNDSENNDSRQKLSLE